MEERVRFDILGPLRCYIGSHEVSFAQVRERALLAMLLLHAGEPVPTATLVDAVWGELLPRNAKGQLQSSIWRLRKLFADAGGSRSAIATDPIGYKIEVAPEDLDLRRFRRLRDEARAAVAVDRYAEANDLYRAALALWRGPALTGIDSSAVRDDAAALDEEHAQTLEACIDIELGRGKGGELIPELTRSVRQHPYRERLHGALMLALYRAGRQADALAAYQRARQLVRDNLGIELGDELRNLHRSILNRELKLHTPRHRIPGGGEAVGFTPAKPRMLPPDIPDFVGRESEIELVRSNLMQQAGEAVSVVVIAGPAGVGKTALSVHVAHRLRAAYPDGQLYINLRGFDEGNPVGSSDALGRFLRSLGVDSTSIHGSMDSTDERTELYRNLLADKRILVVLDNAATEDQLLPLIPGGPSCGVIINGRVPLGITLGNNALRLGPLDETASAELVGRIAGTGRADAESSDASELARLCGHLPLALRIAAGKLAARPHWTIGKLAHQLRDERLRLNHLSHGSLDVRASISLSFAGLSEVAQRLLRRLCEMEVATVGTWMPAALLDVSSDQAERVLDELVDAQLLEAIGQDGTGHARYGSHDLVRLYAKERARHDEPPGELAAARSRALGAWLFIADTVYECLKGGDDYQTVHSTAPRWRVSQELIAALTLNPQIWFDTERVNLITIVRKAAAHDMRDACWDLACTTSPLFRMRRYFDDWSLVLEPALTVVRDSGDDIAIAAVLWRLGEVQSNRQDFQGAWELFRQAASLFANVDHVHGRAAMRAQMATMERYRGQHDSALYHYNIALPVLREAPDRGGEALIQRSIGQIHLDRKDTANAESSFMGALSLYDGLGWRRGQAQTRFWLGMLRTEQARYDEAEKLFEQVLIYTRQEDDRPGNIQALRGLGLCYLRTGQTSLARATLIEALRLATQPRPTLLEGYVRGALEELDSTLTGFETLTEA